MTVAGSDTQSMFYPSLDNFIIFSQQNEYLESTSVQKRLSTYKKIAREISKFLQLHGGDMKTFKSTTGTRLLQSNLSTSVHAFLSYKNTFLYFVIYQFHSKYKIIAELQTKNEYVTFTRTNTN